MKRSNNVPVGALSLCILAIAFCLWIFFGDTEKLCFTAGCSLFRDFTIAGVSLWVFGAVCFTLLAILALARLPGAAYTLSLLALLGDICLMALMMLTAPCINCLVIAVFFLLTYLLFRRAVRQREFAPVRSRRMPLPALLWLILFVINSGAVLKSETGVWAITDNGETASVRMFFSPSCSVCRQGVEKLSGHVEVAFYPVAETPRDIAGVQRIMQSLATGKSMKDAFMDGQQATTPRLASLLSPHMLLLRLRLLRNQAHIMEAGSKVVPFFEYHGLPSSLSRKQDSAAPHAGQAPKPSASTSSAQPPLQPPVPAFTEKKGGNPDLPLESPIAGYCSGATPCGEMSPRDPGAQVRH